MSHHDRATLDVVRRIIKVCDDLQALVDLDRHEFIGDVRTQWAVGMGLIQIGEAVNRLSPTARDEFGGQPWREIVALRNLAAHQYDGLDLDRAWVTVDQDVPALRSYLDRVVLPTLEQRTPSPRLA